jgi:hypothetical protein
MANVAPGAAAVPTSGPPAALDLATRAALEKVHDIVTPPPPSWLPQTWGWVALATALIALGVVLTIRRRRRRAANLYRTEALAELARIEARLATPSGHAGGDRHADTATRADALRALPPLLKRTALAAWPRDEVACLTQASWNAWLRTKTPTPLADAAALPDAAARLLDDLEYRSPAALAALSDDDARACVAAVRRWIETHHVPA